MPTSASAGLAASASFRRLTGCPGLVSLVSSTFSAKLIPGTAVTSCATSAMPASSASRGLARVSGSPSSVISPSSGGTAPARIFASVDLPEPFSPARATISPEPTSKSTPTRALTLP